MGSATIITIYPIAGQLANIEDKCKGMQQMIHQVPFIGEGLFLASAGRGVFQPPVPYFYWQGSLCVNIVLFFIGQDSINSPVSNGRGRSLDPGRGNLHSGQEQGLVLIGLDVFPFQKWERRPSKHWQGHKVMGEPMRS